MSCPNYKRMCNRLVVSQSVSFTDGDLVINIPQDNYINNEKYCIIIAQEIPTTTTITAPVFITIGDGTTQYPLVNCDCTNAIACSINTRTRYSVYVRTTVESGAFVLAQKLPCSRCLTAPAALPIAEDDAAPAEEGGT